MLRTQRHCCCGDFFGMRRLCGSCGRERMRLRTLRITRMIKGDPRTRMEKPMLRCSLMALLLAGFVMTPAGAQERKLPLLFEDDFEKGADRWQPGDAKAWRVADLSGNKVFEQFQASKIKTPHRSPFNYALVKDLSVGDVVLEAKLKSTVKDYGHRDMCLFFGWQDPAHHYYVHMAREMDDRAHQIFIVNG